MKPDCSAIHTLCAFKFLDSDQVLDNLKSELPTYPAISDTAEDVDPFSWWERHAEKVPSWAKACKKVLITLSAVFCQCEKVFFSSNIHH